ncbi:hypothetical protein PAPYR_531 [Paratrimastix pyriformis]|uniref:Uncharacterized protein n=1 Tax=Paratrimastix pyriformis TaxID=342808 RepID=A0ABQ8UXQ9_9EUKA|nr:hypothetical protein PAPYR_531 [Paratrimastix pyriformis]
MANCHLTSLQCPRLRTLRLPDESLVFAPMPMPDLEEVAFSLGLPQPAWLLAGSWPRLRVLSGVRLTRPDLLASLCACGSLVRLEKLRLDVTRLPNPLVLRLPGQLEHLDLHIEMEKSGGPGARYFKLTIRHKSMPSGRAQVDGDKGVARPRDQLGWPGVRVRLRNCPHLVRLDLQSNAIATTALLALEVDKAAMIRRLQVGGAIDAASLLGLLTRHGARLRTFAGWRLRALAKDDWPKLMRALSGLPRLTGLTLNVTGVHCPLSLACPKLRTLDLDGVAGGVKVTLACPRLEWLRDLGAASRQLTFALPAPNLRLHHSRRPD